MAHPGCIPFVPLTPLSPLVPLYPCVEWKHIALPKMNELEISTRMLAALEYTAYRSQRVDLLNKSIDDCRSPTLVRFGLCLVLCKFCLGHRLVCLEFSLDFFDFGFVSREESFDRVDNGSGGIVVEVLRLSDYPCSTRGQSHRPVRYVLGAPWHVACSTEVCSASHLEIRIGRRTSAPSREEDGDADQQPPYCNVLADCAVESSVSA